MKILLDECVDRRLAQKLTGHSVETVASMHWAGIQNGELLKRADASGFEAFVTVDRNLSFQLPVSRFRPGVVVLHAVSNRLSDLLPLVDELLLVVRELKAGEVKHLPSSRK